VSPPRNCTVSIRDTEGVTHTVQVQGSSLFEAAAQAVAAFHEQGWAADAVPLANKEGKFKSGFVLYGAWQTLPRRRWVSVVESVRNRVLEFALRLEEEHPTAGTGT
jgi:hypothetical protein